MPTDEQSLREFHSIWITAVNSRDLDRLLTMITDDLILLNPGESPMGREGFVTTFTEGHRQFVIHCESEIQELEIVGDVAFTRCRDSLAITPRAGGEQKKLAGHRMTIYRKIDGRWLLARDIHNLMPVS